LCSKGDHLLICFTWVKTLLIVHDCLTTPYASRCSKIFRILEVLPLPQIQGYHHLILNLLITTMVLVRQLIYLLIHQRYVIIIEIIEIPNLSLIYFFLFSYSYINALGVFFWKLIVWFPNMICFNIRIWKRRKRNSKPRRLNWEEGNRYAMWFQDLYLHTLLLGFSIVDSEQTTEVGTWNNHVLLFSFSLFCSYPSVVCGIILIPLHQNYLSWKTSFDSGIYIIYDWVTIYKLLENNMPRLKTIN